MRFPKAKLVAGLTVVFDEIQPVHEKGDTSNGQQALTSLFLCADYYSGKRVNCVRHGVETRARFCRPGAGAGAKGGPKCFSGIGERPYDRLVLEGMISLDEKMLDTDSLELLDLGFLLF